MNTEGQTITNKTRVAELFGRSTDLMAEWATIISEQNCPFTNSRCFKIRKSDPETSIGTCIVRYGKELNPLVICPNRFLCDSGQVFTDCLHLLTTHQPGNELHIVSEVSIPGGSVDYFLVSAQERKPVDFVGIEFQGLDTTGTVWPHRQEFLARMGVIDDPGEMKNFGVNWKMTAKTTLVQLHHKIETFQAVNRKLVLVLQQELMDYMAREFSFSHLEDARLGDSMQFHPYRIEMRSGTLSLSMGARKSTDVSGIAEALNLGQSANIAIDDLFNRLALKMSDNTRWNPIHS